MNFIEWFRKKRQPQFVYTFLCRNCDILYQKTKLDTECPACHQDGKIYTVRDYNPERDSGIK